MGTHRPRLSFARPVPAATLCVTLALAAAVAAVIGAPAAARAASPSLSAAEWATKGHLHFKVGEYEEARAAYETAYALDRHPAHLYNLALVHAALGRPGEALHYYRKLLAADPASPLRVEVEGRIRALEASLTAPPAASPAGAPAPAPARRARPGWAVWAAAGGAVVLVAGGVVTGIALATSRWARTELGPTEL